MMLPDANAMLDSKMIMMAKILEPWESSATAVFHSTIQVKSLKLAMMELKIELYVPVCENCVQQMVLGQLYNRASLHELVLSQMETDSIFSGNYTTSICNPQYYSVTAKRNILL